MLNLSFFAAGHVGYYLLIAVFAGCIVALISLNSSRRRKPKSRADELQERYRHLTADLLAATPDDEVVTAVVANLMAKLKKSRPDPLVTIPQLSRGRNAVYFVWLFCKEAEKNGVEALLKKPAVRFLESGIAGLETVGAEATAAAARALIEPSEDIAEEERFAALEAALQAEQPLSLCRDYIRAMPDDFVDEPQ